MGLVQSALSNHRQDLDPVETLLFLSSQPLVNSVSVAENIKKLIYDGKFDNDSLWYNCAAEDILVWVEILSLLKPNQTNESFFIDKNDLMALVFKLNSPEKLCNLIFGLAIGLPSIENLVGKASSSDQEILTNQFAKWIQSRLTILNDILLLIKSVHSASNDDTFLRYFSSHSMVKRCEWVVQALGLLEAVNNAKILDGSSILLQYLSSNPINGQGREFEDFFVELMVGFGFWLECKKLVDLALLWLESFHLFILDTAVSIDSSFLAALDYVRGRLFVASGQSKKAFETLIASATIFNSQDSQSIATFTRLVEKHISFDHQQSKSGFFLHLLNLASSSGQTQIVTYFCNYILSTYKSAGDQHVMQTDDANFEESFLTEVEVIFFDTLCHAKEFQKALTNLSGFHMSSDRKREFVLHLLDILFSDENCSKTLLQLSFGEWTEEVEIFLERQSIHQPQLSRISFSYFISKIEYQKASAAIYTYSQAKDTNDEESEMALILAKQTLLLLPSEFQWAILKSTIITPESLEREIVLKKVARFVEERKPLVPVGALDDTVIALISFGAYSLAFDYLREVIGESRDRLFHELAKDFLLHKSPQPSSSLEWVDLWFEGRECVAADPSGCILKIFKECVDGEEPAERYRFYHIFLSAVFSQSTDPYLLTDSFYSDYMGLNANSLISTLLNFGFIDHAAKFCQLAISQSSQLLSETVVAKVAETCQLQQIRESCKSYLNES